jgi:hypothetical protein
MTKFRMIYIPLLCLSLLYMLAVDATTLPAKSYEEPSFWKPNSYKVVSVQLTPFTDTQVISTGGVPPGGYCADTAHGNSAWNGPVQLRMAAGNLGGNGYANTCSNFVFQYNQEDGFGMPFVIFNNNINADPQVALGVTRQNNGIRSNSLFILQKDSGPPGWDMFGSGPGLGVIDPTSVHARAGLLVTQDVSTAQVGMFYSATQFVGLNRTIYAVSDATVPGLVSAYGNMLCCPTNGTEVWRLEDNGHQHVGGAHASGALSVSSCGEGNPSIAGGDNAFVITLGNGTPTACKVTFHTSWKSTDLTCTFISESDAVNWKFAKVGSANAWTGVILTASNTLTNGSKIHGVCIGHV